MPDKKTSSRRPYGLTRVSALETRLEIKVLIDSANDIGLSHPEWHSGSAAVLRFQVQGRPCQVELRPDADVNADDESRRLHRVLLHFLKNSIEAVRSGLLSVNEALMAFHITVDGKMLGEAVFNPGIAGRPIVLALPEGKPSRTTALSLPRGGKR